MCFEFPLYIPCFRPWRRHDFSPPTVKLNWCTRRAHGGVVRVAPERLPAPARQYRTSNTLIVRLGVCFHCGKYLRARLVLIFMRASDHSSSRFMPSCHSARSSPRRPFRWKSVAPGRYASLERACFSRRSGRPRWRVRKAAACTIHVVGRARRVLPSPPPRCAGAWWTYPRRHVKVPHFSTEHARYFARIRRQLLGIWRLCLLWM